MGPGEAVRDGGPWPEQLGEAAATTGPPTPKRFATRRAEAEEERDRDGVSALQPRSMGALGMGKWMLLQLLLVGVVGAVRGGLAPVRVVAPKSTSVLERVRVLVGVRVTCKQLVRRRRRRRPWTPSNIKDTKHRRTRNKRTHRRTG